MASSSSSSNTNNEEENDEDDEDEEEDEGNVGLLVGFGDGEKEGLLGVVRCVGVRSSVRPSD